MSDTQATLAQRPAPEARPQLAGRLVGYLAEFDTVDGLLAAARRCREKGFTRWDCHTPFPIHGLERAMGIRRTVLPWIVFACGLAGAATGFLLQWYTNAYDYPIRVSGKPYLSFAVYIPIMFELTVLFAAFGAFIGMLALNGLPKLYDPLFLSERFRRASDDRFFISVEAQDPLFEEGVTDRFLAEAGAVAVERVEEPA